MLNNSLRTNLALRPRFDDRMRSERNGSFVPRIAMLRSVDQHSRADKEGEQSRHHLPGTLSDFHVSEVVDQAVEIFPSDAVTRRRLAWNGMAIEVVQALTHDKVEFRFRGSLHLLVAYEEGIRSNGETLIEGLPRSTLRDVKRKLAFVPAGHEYREWQEPRTRGRIVYFYFDPAKTPLAPSAGAAGTALAPRLFFEDNTPWETVVKMAALIENGAENRQYCEAHELVCQHHAERIPLATLARFVRLSAYHFCRAFKRSFGMPPHRYHNTRRIEHAKMLLAQPACSVTEIALKVGFSETSSFTAAFRKTTGSTPTAYRRSLA